MRERDHDVVAPDLPCDDDSAGLTQYADTVIDAIGDRTDLIVVAHSFGGFTAPLVCSRVPVDLLVLVAAMVPLAGEDAEYLARRGFATTGFDIAPTAIDGARRRFPNSAVRYLVADLLDLPVRWRGAFDLVFEICTVQALPISYRRQATYNVGSLVAPGERSSSSPPRAPLSMMPTMPLTSMARRGRLPGARSTHSPGTGSSPSGSRTSRSPTIRTPIAGARSSAALFGRRPRHSGRFHVGQPATTRRHGHECERRDHDEKGSHGDHNSNI